MSHGKGLQMSRLLSEFDGEVLYLDTMIFYRLLREEGSPAEPLFRRIQANEIQAYTSVLTFDELAYRLLLARIRDCYTGNPLDNLRQNEHKLIGEFAPQIESVLVQTQNFPNLFLIDFTVADLVPFYQLMCKYQLRPRDALHLAAMLKVDCLAIVSQDSDFDHITDIQCYKLLG
jgi:predicted nucleic acid-binding protein